MENQITMNPDRRPLPDGWIQHYEPAKQIWCGFIPGLSEHLTQKKRRYYVQIAVAPPTVTFIHPADIMGGAMVNRTRSPTSPTASAVGLNPTTRQSPNSHAQFSSMRPQGMTVAQKLYASSGGSAAAAPMINANSITSLSTSVDAASSPSPPPNSNRVSMLPSPAPTSLLGSEIPRPISYMPPSRHSVQGHGGGMNQHNNRPGSYASGRESSVDALSLPYHNRVDHNPHRAATVPAFPLPTTSMGTIPERSHSQAGPVASNFYSLGPRPTPHLLTTARPAYLETTAALGKVNFVTSPPLTTSPPSTSLLFAKPAEGTSPSNYNYFSLNQQSYSTADPNAVGLDPPSLLAMLKTALAMNPIAESELRAVAYGEQNAKYQAVLNALKQQQHYRSTTSSKAQAPSGIGGQQRPNRGSVDYQLLIIEVGRLELKVSLVQQTQQGQFAQQQQVALDAFTKQQEVALAQQQQQSLLSQQAQQQVLLNSQLQQQQQQNAALAQQQVLLNQQAQQEAMLKLQLQQQHQAALAQQQAVLNQQAPQQALKLQLQQQQQAAMAQQQAILKQQADEQAALKLQLQQQQQQMAAQQQALMQANQMNQQQLHALQQQQVAQQQLLAQQAAPVNHPQQQQPAPYHQGGQQQQQQQQSGFGSHSQQSGGQGPQLISKLFQHAVHSLSQDSGGSAGSHPSGGGANSTTDTGNVGLMDSITQSLNNFGGGGQDPSSGGLSGLFGGSGSADLSGGMDFSSLTSNVDFSSMASGLDFSSFGSNDN